MTDFQVQESERAVEPLYIRPWIAKGQALTLRFLLHEAAMGYAPSNPRVKLYQQIEKEIAEAWPEEALK